MALLSREELRALPKVELHNHLEGMIRISTIVELCNQFQIEVPGYDPSRPDDITAFREKFLGYKKVDNIEVFFNKFWEIQSLLRTEEVIERVAFEACEDCYNDGIRLVEFRYSPSFIARSRYSDHSHFTYESVLAAIKRGFARAQAQYDIAVGLICIIDRSEPFDDEFEVFKFMMAHRDDFVGIDIANSELFPCKPFAPWYQQARAVGLGLTCHSGEASNAESVKITIDELDVTRIGHGFLSIHDSNVVSLLKEKRVLLEICPMSNYLTGSVESLESHPVRQLLDAGVLLSINSDDAGMFGTSILDDYDCLQRYHRFTQDEFRATNLAALEASFLSRDIKESIRQKYFE